MKPGVNPSSKPKAILGRLPSKVRTTDTRKKMVSRGTFLLGFKAIGEANMFAGSNDVHKATTSAPHNQPKKRTPSQRGSSCSSNHYEYAI